MKLPTKLLLLGLLSLLLGLPFWLTTQAADTPQKAETETKASPGPQYETLSPAYSGPDIKVLIEQLTAVAPGLAPILLATLEKRDYPLNESLLARTEGILKQRPAGKGDEAKIQDIHFKEMLGELEIQVYLLQKQPDKAMIKKALTNIFSLKQEGRRLRLAELQSELSMLQKDIDTREKEKDKLIEQKLKEVVDHEQLKWD